MKRNVTLKVLPHEAASSEIITQYLASSLAIPSASVTGFRILKHSIDARSRQPTVNLTIETCVDEPFHRTIPVRIKFKDTTKSSRRILIIGGGPAGLFAALKLLESGIKPVIIERGKDVRARRRDLAILNKEGVINPESNYCFGEGGAGTYSDGKLYTRSSKRGSVERILNLFVQFGADEKILYESHPHIGTNKLPHIITAIRKQIIHCGGEFLFEKKVIDFIVRDQLIQSVVTTDGQIFKGDAVILATGHSARDIFQLLDSKKILIEAKPFALGVRVEHPQQLIDSMQYHTAVRDEYLPPASYNLVHQAGDRGVFSFCMCPGGIIAPAATNNGEIVVNGWSPSKRNNPFANSGIVVEVRLHDLRNYNSYSESKEKVPPSLLGIFFQSSIERKAFEAGGGAFVAPAQRMVDLVNNKRSSSLPSCSYLPGVQSADLSDVLPAFIYGSLQTAFKEFGKKMKGYFTNDAIVVATESRTSSPVRIPRDVLLLHHPEIKNLYPCGEGGGYAGGIVSAAMDGERVASAIIKNLASVAHKQF
ncbi:MAG TPA: FAD-dependent monooxygenase [Parafilimonas sp.]|nr:FAD-dependent monooxygenase [Parafilimonas sp.]